MTVKANHRHVSPDGLCYLPYLAEWTVNSNLNGLVEIASSVFSIEPPLFTKPPGGSVASPTSTVASPSSARSAYGAAQVNPSYNPTPYSHNASSSSANGTYESYASPASNSSSVYSPASSATSGAFASSASYQQVVQKETEADKKAQLIDQVCACCFYSFC